MNKEELLRLAQLVNSAEDKPEGEGWFTREEWSDKLREAGCPIGVKRLTKFLSNNAEIYNGNELVGDHRKRRVWYRIDLDEIKL